MRTIDKPTHSYNLRSRGGVDRKAKKQPKNTKKTKMVKQTKPKALKIAVRKTQKVVKVSLLPQQNDTVSTQNVMEEPTISLIQPREDIPAPQCLFDIKTCHLNQDFDLQTLMGQDDIERKLEVHSLFDQLISGPDSSDFFY